MHCVEEKLKKRQKIYQITRTEAEVRVNDYNPLLLLLWESQYVTGSEKRYIVAHIFKIELLAPRGRVSSQL